MMAYESMSYWDAYNMPVPFRKWLIQRYNKHQENDGNPSPDAPMTQAERMKMISQAQGFSRTEQKQQPQAIDKSTFFNPMRNKR